MEQRETAGLTVRLVFDEMRRERGDEGAERLAARAGGAGGSRAGLSFEARAQLFEAARETSGDDSFSFRAGASVMSSPASSFFRAVAESSGSLLRLVASYPLVHSRLDTACEVEVRAERDGYCLVALSTRPPRAATGHDCRFAMGVLSALCAALAPPAVELRQQQCQAEGAPACLIEVRWKAGRRGRRHRAGAAGALVELPRAEPAALLLPDGGDEAPVRQGAREPAAPAPWLAATLGRAISQLLGVTEVGELVSAVARHASSGAGATSLLLAVRADDRAPLEVAGEGLEPGAARVLGERLLAGGAAATAAVAELASGSPAPALVHESDVGRPGHCHGRLVAVASTPFAPEDRELLDAYALLASVLLDSSTAPATRGRSTGEQPDLAARLQRADGTGEVARTAVEAAHQLTFADRTAFLAHVEETGSLEPVSHLGFPAELAPRGGAGSKSGKDAAGLRCLLAAPGLPLLYDRSTEDPALLEVLDLFGADSLAAATVGTSARLYGVLCTAWSGARPDPDDLGGQLARIADEAARAWERALRLDQVPEHSGVDALTGLANRRAFTELLADLLAARGGPSVGVVFCDLDRFKGVNDILGHALGDELLVEIGRRLQHCVRSDDLVARLGGDQFTVLLAGVDDEWNPELFAAKLHELTTEPIEIDGAPVVVRFSLGAVVAQPGELSVRDVLRRADAAMYAAKALGGDRLARFQPEMLVERADHLEIEASLVLAVADMHQFLVVYQPQVDMLSGAVVGTEALVRWQHPGKGLLAPERFLEIAERTGLVIPIDFHVLRTALGQLAEWEGAGLPVRMAVNFSARTLARPGLVDAVREELSSLGVEGSSLEIELTESTAVSDPDALGAILEELRGLGVSIAIDDVGTGYSSLALLHKLPAQRLKLDRSFVQRITDDPASRSVVEAVLLLADRLGQSVVAEGIETREQGLELKALGCDLAQGFFFSAPSSAASIERFVREGLSPLVG